MSIPSSEGEKHPCLQDSELWKSFLESLDVTSLKTSPLCRISHKQKHPRFSTFHFREKTYVFLKTDEERKSDG